MPRIGRRSLLVAGALAGSGLLSYELWPRDESRIVDFLSELCTKLNQTRDEASLGALRDALREDLLPQVSVRAPELDPGLEGLESVLRGAAMLLNGAPLSFALSSVDVHLSGRLAQADADLSATVRGSGEQRRDLRHVRFRLAKPGAEWRVEAVEVDAAQAAEPEARP